MIDIASVAVSAVLALSGSPTPPAGLELNTTGSLPSPILMAGDEKGGTSGGGGGGGGGEDEQP